jgi:hypothetical protein
LESSELRLRTVWLWWASESHLSIWRQMSDLCFLTDSWKTQVVHSPAVLLSALHCVDMVVTGKCLGHCRRLNTWRLPGGIVYVGLLLLDVLKQNVLKTIFKVKQLETQGFFFFWLFSSTQIAGL